MSKRCGMRFFHLPWFWRRSAAGDVADDDLPDGDAAELEAWAADVEKKVADEGFDRAFKDNYARIAEVADKYPTRAEKYVERWVHEDAKIEREIEDGKRTRAPREYKPAAQTDRTPDSPVPGVDERDGTPVKVYHAEVFRNWGDTVEKNTSYTFVPTTKVGVINIVKFARENGFRVRAAGSRHSWSNIYGDNGDVIISLMEIDAALPVTPFGPKKNPQDNELERVQFDGTFIGEDGTKHGRIRLGGAATSEHFRKWALETQGGNWEWMIRALPILTAITSAGWTQPICHGAGIKHQSVSDLCVEMEIVNCRGELQVISDKEQLKAAAGGFGLLGIIVSHVFVLDPMKIANLYPKDVPTPLAVPPLCRADVPENDDFDVSSYSDSDLEAAQLTFFEDCKKFYAEWFWFPFQPDCWINCWDVVEPTNERPVYPDAEEVHAQEIQASLGRLFETTALKFLSGKKQAELTGWAAMRFLPDGNLLPTSVCDAVHFRRGIHRMPVRDCEIEIEIPARADGSSDFSICQKAWWMAIQEVYGELPNAPMRTTLEMRIIGNSDTTLSTQNGYDHGTCSIEVLTNTLVSDDDWKAFVDKVVARWSTLTNPLTGEPLKVRPHFAKEWPTTIRGLPVMQHLRKTYADKIPLFNKQLREAAIDGGYELHEALKMFGNDTILTLIDENGL